MITPNSSVALTALTLDGIAVQIADQGAQIVQRHIAGLDAKIATLTTQAATDKDAIADLKKQIEARDAEIATLKQSAEDAKMSPDKLQALVSDRAVTERVAKAVLGDADRSKLATDAIKKEVVVKKLGDAASGWSDDQISVSFATLASSISDAEGGTGKAPSGRDFGASLMSQTKDDDIETKLAKAAQDRDGWLSNAYKPEQKGA